MFVDVDFSDVQIAAQDASSRGKDPVLTSQDRLREEAMKRKILQADVLQQISSISPQNLIYVVLDYGEMEGLYILDCGREVAWRWEAEDEGDDPFIANPPGTTGTGLPKICGTCDNSEGPRYRDVYCSLHNLTLTTHHTCREWTLRSNL